MEASALNVLVKVVDRHSRNVVAITALQCVARLVPELDSSQLRTLVLLLRKVMAKVAEPSFLATCCALAHVIANAPDRQAAVVVSQARVTQANGSPGGGAGGEDATPSSAQGAGLGGDAVGRLRELDDERLQLHAFMTEQLVPLIGLVLDHFGSEDDTLRVAADMALRSLATRLPGMQFRQRFRVAPPPPPEEAEDSAEETAEEGEEAGESDGDRTASGAAAAPA